MSLKDLKMTSSILKERSKSVNMVHKVTTSSDNSDCEDRHSQERFRSQTVSLVKQPRPVSCHATWAQVLEELSYKVTSVSDVFSRCLFLCYL